ncbi:CAZyme family GH92 [Aspergillus niger]|nr:CAZyme family GH92 [Aspergillus niger]KAI2880925.1 CAZyme family GH92 [Aspergillus niger]KAI2886304.1 CAZyme family GH92 [Aspergillus niger]KAI2898230.1 CAZyme family GH92 [Aspergillus niger]KAI2940484.1 CAZyme family GH92 [Aspergillus niger]
MRVPNRLLLLALGVSDLITAAQVDYSQYVNPFMGSEGPTPGQGYGGGDIFVGGARPFGVAKVGLDTTAANWSIAVLNGGWTPDGNVTAVTMMHESGTGGAPKYGLIPQMPLTSVESPVNLLDNLTYSQPRVGNDSASIGYFRTLLQNGVQIELSASRHAGIIQYSFPDGEKHVLVDISHYLPGSPGDSNGQFYVGGEISLEDDGNAYSGYGTYVGGWNNGAPFTVYFYGEFSTAPKNARTFTGANTDPMPRYQNLANGGIPQPTYGNTSDKATSGPMNDRIGALFSWDTETDAQISSRVGISFISTEKARSYITSEIPSWTLNDTVQAAVDEWNQDVFSKTQVSLDSTANMTNVRLLYSSLYFIHLMPSDRTGENPLWQSDEPFWDDFYTLWDIFRCTVSFYHVYQPTYYESMIRGLIDIWRHQGFLPDGRSGNWNGLVQGGSDADNMLADAYVKGLRGAINWTDGYAAMKTNAEVISYNTWDATDLSASTKEGRGALGDWLELGYVSQDRNTRCISRTVEYSLNDFAVSQVAAGEEPSEQEKYLNRSAGWQHIWNPDVQSLNFTGFLAPKFSNGSFNNSGYDPRYCYGCEWLAYTYEGVPWEYSFVLPHDMETLIDYMGGADTFESRLDIMFEPNMSVQNLGANGAGITTIINIGNEPDFATPYLYNYINKQAKSVEKSRNLGYQYFRDDAYGVPGNSDAGAMNSWLLWQMLGIYPVVTQPVYLLSSPWFPDLNMTVNGNQTLRIIANGLDKGYYVQSVKINGQAWTKNWFEHEDVMTQGGTIEFELGADMTAWDTGSVPPSPGHRSI